MILISMCTSDFMFTFGATCVLLLSLAILQYFVIIGSVDSMGEIAKLMMNDEFLCSNMIMLLSILIA